MHQPEPGRVGVLVTAADGDPGQRGPLLGDETLVRLADLGQVPGPADQAHRAGGAGGVRRTEPFETYAGLVEQQVHVLGGPGGDPGLLVERAVAEVAQVGGEPLAVPARARRVQHQQIEPPVPGNPSGAVDPGGRLVEPAGRFWCDRIARSGTELQWFEPTLTHHPGDRRADGRWGDPERCQELDQGGNRCAATPWPEVVAVQVEECRPCLHDRTL
ncbi:hypothetical protein Jiend_21780 [Micromonospora endophytica]|nr:hypothetical protein Jiend_21780 [Micromonospora endophytica]